MGFERRWSKDGYVFRKNRDIPVDLPGATVERWVGLFLNPWWGQIDNTVLRDQRQFECFIDALSEEISRSILKSVWWKRLRYALRKELGLDSDVLRWCRKGSHRVAQAAVMQDRYNRTVNCRADYEQLERENPNLIWVYNLALDDKVFLMPGDLVAALKEAVMRRQVPPWMLDDLPPLRVAALLEAAVRVGIPYCAKENGGHRLEKQAVA